MFKKLIRKIRSKIVKNYIPDDDMMDLADALYTWRNPK